MTKTSTEQTPVIYVCAHCDRRFVSNTAYEADKPNGYYLELRKVDGGKYTTHTKTPAPVFFCSDACLVEGVQDDLPGILQPTVPE